MPSEIERRRLFRTLAYLVSTQGATSLLGFAYWPIATHFFSVTAVGIAATATSTGSLLVAIGILGISTMLVAEIRDIDEEKHFLTVTTGVVVGCATVLVLSLATLLLSPFLGASLKSIGHSVTASIWFVAGAVALVAGTVLDSVAVGLRKGQTQLFRGITASGFKILSLVILAVVGAKSGATLIFASSGGVVLSVFLAVHLLGLRPHPSVQSDFRARAEVARGFARLSLNHHVLNLAINSVYFVLPFVAAVLVSSKQLAYFAGAQVISGSASLLPYLIAYALFAETANDEALLRRLLRRTFPSSLLASVGVILVVVAAAPEVLSLFGSQYSSHGSLYLRLLVVGGLPYVVKDHYVAIRRTQRRLPTAARVLAAWTALEIAAGALGGAIFGLNGLCIGWDVAAFLEGFALLPSVWTVFRLASPHPGATIET